MAFNVSTFKANALKRGGARPALFEVRFAQLPPGVPALGQTVSFHARASQLPGSIVDTVNIPYMGRRIPFAGDRVFQNWTIMVMNDEDFAVRNMFEAWHNKMNALISNRQDSPPGDMLDYKVQASVLQYGKAGPGTDEGVIREYTFNDLFPVEIEPIGLDWEAVNSIEQFGVTFAYSEWTVTDFGLANPYQAVIAPDPTTGTIVAPNS